MKKVVSNLSLVNVLLGFLQNSMLIPNMNHREAKHQILDVMVFVGGDHNSNLTVTGTQYAKVPLAIVLSIK